MNQHTVDDLLRLLTETQQEIEELRALIAGQEERLKAWPVAMGLVAEAFAQELNFDDVPAAIAGRLKLSAIQVRKHGFEDCARQLEFVAGQILAAVK